MVSPAVGVCLTEAGESIPPRGASLLLRWQGFSLVMHVTLPAIFPVPMPRKPRLFPGQLDLRLPAQPCGPGACNPAGAPEKAVSAQARPERKVAASLLPNGPNWPTLLSNGSLAWLPALRVRGAFTCLCRRGWWLHRARLLRCWSCCMGAARREVTWPPSRA